MSNLKICILADDVWLYLLPAAGLSPQVGDVMRLAVTLVDGMSSSMLNFTAVGDPAVWLELENVTMQVKKERLEDVSSEAVVARQGSLDLPEITSLIDIGPGGCVQQAVFFASFNPHLWAESSDQVNSHTLRFNLESCDSDNDGDGGTRRRRRSIGDEAGLCHTLTLHVFV